MNKKLLIQTLILVASLAFLYWFTDFQGRMDQINRETCAVYGYEPDCETPLKN